MRPWPLAVLCSVLGCRELTLPAADLPGSVSATLLAPRAGRAELSPAVGATLEIVGTGTSAIADEDGNVRLNEVNRTQGQLRASYRSADTGETFERVFDLALAGVRPGRSTSLGTVALGRRATLLGYVRRADLAANTGHAGIRVFVPESPLIATTADDGFFVLPGVPAGDLSLSAFATGYEVVTSQLEIRAGEERRLDLQRLKVSTSTATGTLSGTVLDPSGQPFNQVVAKLDGTSAHLATMSAADGRYEFGGLQPDVYQLRITAPGFLTRRIDNLYFDGTTRELPSSTLVQGTDPEDGGTTSGDGGVVVIPGQAVELVSINGGEIGQKLGDDAGTIQIPIPASTRAGDLVVLFEDRFFIDLPDLSYRKPEWNFLGSQVIDGDCAEVAVRRAGTDEANSTGVYTMHVSPFANSIAWAMAVYRNVDSVELVHISTEDTRVADLPAGLVFSPQPVARGDRILSAVAFAQFPGGSCPAPVSADGGVLEPTGTWRSLGYYQLLDLPAAAGGTVPGLNSACDPSTGVSIYASYQLRLHAAP